MREISLDLDSRHYWRPARSRIRPMDPRAIAAQPILAPLAMTLVRIFIVLTALAFFVLRFASSSRSPL